LTPMRAGFIERRGSRLRLLKSTFSAENFTLEMRVVAQNREKFTKTPYFGD